MINCALVEKKKWYHILISSGYSILAQKEIFLNINKKEKVFQRKRTF